MFRKIMIVLDDHPPSQAAVQQGLEVARVHAAQVIYLYLAPAYVFPMVDMQGGGMAAFAAHTAEQFEQQAQATASSVLKAAQEVADAAGVASSCSTVPGEVSVDHVTEAVAAHGCDLVVVASSGSNAVVRLLTGNIIPGLISRCPVPVLVCPAHT